MNSCQKWFQFRQFFPGNVLLSKLLKGQCLMLSNQWKKLKVLQVSKAVNYSQCT